MLTLVLLLIPLFSSAITLLFRGSSAKYFALLSAISNLIITILAYFVFINTDLKDEEARNIFVFNHEWISSPKINFHIAMDGISFLMVFLTNLLLPLIILSGFKREINRLHIFYSLILFMQFALLGVFVSFDGILYYLFWELALIPIYFISLNWGDKNRVSVTIKFFIYTLAGSLLMLFGFICLYWYNPTHSFDWNDLTKFQVLSTHQGLIFWLFFVAYAIKIPIIPFHTWQPDTYQSAPTQGTMLLSGIMLKMGTYSLIRWLLPIVPTAVTEWTPLAIALCVAGIVYASIIAIMQTDLKKLLAFSSIAHVGLIAAGIFAWNIQGIQGSLIQMLAHGINVIGLFYCADIIFNRTQSNNINGLGGIRLIAPKFATYFLIIILGSIALPLTNGFIGEFLLLYGLFEYNTWLAIFGGLTIILGAVYMLRMYQKVALGNSLDANMKFEDGKGTEEIVLLTICILIFAFGVFPKPTLELVEPIAQFITDKAILK